MLRFISSSDATKAGVTRREWLRLGGLGCLGMGAGISSVPPAIARDLASHLPGFGKAKSVLLVYASGGQSQLDTWDPKPLAPEGIRGEFKPIKTSVPGIQVCEHMPRLARLAHRYAILRSVSHDDLDHGSATYLALTGQFHPRKSSNPPPRSTDFPTYGAIVQRVRPARQFPHTAVHINGPALVPEVVGPGQFAGFLGRACDPLQIGDVSQEQVAVHGLSPLEDVPTVRLEARRRLLQSVERFHHKLGQDQSVVEMNTLYRQAYEMLESRHCRQAFDLSQEPDAIRQRYGKHRSGQACLLARRLVEAGVPWITVIWNHTNRGQDKAPDDTAQYGWDTHNDIFDALKVHLLPRFDATFSVLLTDLHDRGLLDKTLVVCMGEFGRAPRVALEATFAGSSPGRKHWAAVYSIVLAGAGIAGGKVVGASDRIGAYPSTQPVSPTDVAATMFAALGIDPGGHYLDPSNRPYAIASGKPIRGLYD